MNIKIINDCCLTHLPKIDENSVDAIITDPPYEIGFMNRDWDEAGVAYAPGVWRECLRILKPGAHLLAFGGTRTYHKLASAIENENFEIRDVISWLYGTGFPKSKNLGEGLGTQLKPAQELIVLARKPLSEKTIAENVLRWGTGGININACRIPAPDGKRVFKKGIGNAFSPNPKDRSTGLSKSTGETSTEGRWPANVATDQSPEVEAEMPNSAGNSGGTSGTKIGVALKIKMKEPVAIQDYHDNGSASRFFYCAKASRKEREFGLVTEKGKRSNDHPTVKPIELMRWLCRLITPKGGLIIDPFLGSGTTGIAAHLEGFDFIGIEQNADFAELARQRIDGWTSINIK